MARFTIEIDTDALPEHTDKKLKKWVEFNIGARPEINGSNPLNLYDLTAKVIECN